MNDAARHAIRISAVLNGAGGWETFDIDAQPAAAAPPGDRWVHINANHPDAGRILAERFGLPEKAVEALLAEEIRPRYIDMGENALLFLRGITMVPGPDPGDLASLRLWMTPNMIISASRRKSHVADTLRRQLTAGDGPRNRLEMLGALLEIINDALEPVLQELDDTLAELEDILNEDSPTPRKRFAELRREISQYRRHLSPQRDMLMRLGHTERSWMDHETRWQVQEAYDRTTRFIEDLDNLRERTEIVADDMTNAQDVHLNKNIYILSIITVIFMPLTFLTGLLGMNVQGIPWADRPWAFGGIVGLSAVVILLQVLLFRRFRWI